MKFAKKFSKLFLIASTFSLLINTFFPLFYAFPVIAEDSQDAVVVEDKNTEEPEVKQEELKETTEDQPKESTEDSNIENEEDSTEGKTEKPETTTTPEPNPTVTPNPTPTVDVSPTPEIDESSEATENEENKDKESLRLEEPRDTNNSSNDYEDVSEDKITFIENAKTNVWYEYKDSGFKVKFTQLDGEAKLVIEQITLTDEQVENLGAVSNKAYDVYFEPTIDDGKFEYELHFPVDSTSEDIKIKYSEDKQGLQSGELNEVEEEVKVEDGSAKVEGLDHFTTFVVTTDPSLATAPFCIANADTPATDCFNTLVAAVAAAGSGDTIKIEDGNYTETSTINIASGKDGLIIEGESKSGVVISNTANYGFSVTADNVTIKNVTIETQFPTSGYHMKIAHNSGFTIEDVVLDGNGNYSSGLDLNTVQDVTVKNVEINNYGKNLIAVTSTCNDAESSENITFENIDISGGGWTAMAFYTESGPSCAAETRDIKGVEFKGTNYIKSSPIGIYLSGVKESAGVVTDEYNTVVEGKNGDRLEIGDTAFSSNATNIVNWTIGDVGALEATFDGVTGVNSTSADIDSVESKLIHDCNASPYVAGLCNDNTGPFPPNGDKDLTPRYGSIEYATQQSPYLCYKWDCLSDEHVDFLTTGRHGGAGGYRNAIENPDASDKVNDNFSNPWPNGEYKKFAVSYTPYSFPIPFPNVTYIQGEGNDQTILTYEYDSGKAFEYILIFAKGNSDNNSVHLKDVTINGNPVQDLFSNGDYYGLKIPVSDADQENGIEIEGYAKLVWGDKPKDEVPAFNVYFLNTHNFTEPCVEGPGYPLTPDLNDGLDGFTVLGTQKNGNPLPAERSDLGNAVGVPDGKFLSLGVGGVWTFAHEAGVINNVDGYDLSFHEVTDGRDTYPEELLKVEVSQDFVDWVEIGVVSNKSNDGGSGVGHLSLPDYWTWAKFVRVTDITDYSNHSSNADGYDLDAIDVVMQGCNQPDYEPIPPQIPKYESLGQCTEGVPLESTKQTVFISSTDTDGTFVTLDTNKEYLFRAYGTYNSSGTRWISDSGGYSSNDSWSTVSPLYGIEGSGENYGAHALLGDLGENVGVINWGSYTPTHEYNFYYKPTTTNLQLVIGDRYSDWFGTPYDNQKGMRDNSGSLSVDILECGTPNGEIKGYKYIGDQDLPKQGVEINICPVDGYNESCNGDTQSTSTNDSGYYEFKDLTPGIYKVWETVVSGFEPMYPAGGFYYVEVLGGTSYKYLGNLVNNGSFENPVVTHNKKWDIYPDGTSGLGWKVEWNGGSLTYGGQTRPTTANLELHKGVNNWSSEAGSQHAELDADWDGPNGSLNNEPSNIKITQRVPQCTNGTFDFSYAYSPRPNQSNNSMQVFWGGVLETQSGSGANNVNWTTVNHTGLTSSGLLGFAENGTPNALGMFVDDVLVEQNAECSDGFVNFYNNQTEIPKSTVTVNKYNDLGGDGKIGENDPKIDDWGVVIHKISDEKLIEELNVESNDPNGEDTVNTLDSAKKYLVEVTGTWTNQKGARAVDADYYSDNTWSTVKDFDDDNTRDPRQLDLVINNNDINWASYNSSHLYKYILSGTDSTVNFRIFDEDNDTNKPSWYNDNEGSLNVKIYDVTDEYYKTPVDFEVEPGEYQIVEELVAGWDQTYPTNPSYYHMTLAEGEDYNFDFANYQLPTTTDVTVCKLDDNQAPLQGWTISLLGEKVETVQVNPDGNNYSSSVLLEDDYVLVASGSYEYRGNSGLITDPAYSERLPSDSVYGGSYVPFVNIMDLGTAGALGIMVNGAATNWSNYYNPAHIYHLGYLDYSGQFDFSVYDDVYSDNVGFMNVDVYKGYTGVTGENGCFTLQGVEYGNYDVSEVLMQNWENVSGLGKVEINDDNNSVTVVNKKNTYDIHGFKFDDVNNDSEFDSKEENKLSGWTIFIDENGNKQLDEGETSTTTSSEAGENYGWYWFKDLPAGDYSICEVQQEGFTQTYPLDNACHTVSVPYGNNKEFVQNSVYAPMYNFGNHFEAPELTIEKFNNVNNGAILSEKGGLVTYTLNVTANKNNVNNVVVTDLPPLGFSVQNPGTWEVTSDVDGTYSVPDPAYASPGDWQLGDMQKGETVTITYTAKIDENIDPGLYKDLAFAVGGNPRTEEDILATAQPTGYVDTNYVGTAALIDEDPTSPNADADIDEETEEEEVVVDEEGAVLGASTALPATGSPMWLITLALILLASGISIVVYSKKKKTMKTLLLPFALVTILSLSSVSVHAAGLSVRVEDPKTPTNTGFNLSYVAMDIQQRPVSAKCLVKKPGSVSFVQFKDTTLINGGTSNSCTVDTSVLTTEGTFEFKVEVIAGADTSEDTTTVFYDGTNPGKPKDLNVDKKSSCKYEIDFKTANDGGQTSYVEIYRDDSTSFTVNDSTRITTISATSNQKVEYTDNLAGSQCGSRQYYAVRAFDTAGNASDVLGEDVVEIKYVTTTTTSTSTSSSESTNEGTGETGAIAVRTGGSALGTGGEGTEGAEVTAQDENEEGTSDENNNNEENNESSVDEENGEVQGAFTKAISNKWVIILSIFGLIGILALVLSYVKGKKIN